MLGSAFTRRDAADALCAISDGLLRMERPGFTRHPLRNDFGVFVD